MFLVKEMHHFLREQAKLDSVFERYRVVEPYSHRVFKFNENQEDLKDTGALCYDFWKKGVPCSNCISKHTCTDGKEYVKMETVDGKIYLVSSLPIIWQGKKYALELAKDVTNSMVENVGARNTDKRISEVIDTFNNLATKDLQTGLFKEIYVRNELDNIALGASKHNENLMVAYIYLDKLLELELKVGKEVKENLAVETAQMINRTAGLHNGWAGRVGINRFAMFFRAKTAEQVEEICAKMLAVAEKQPSAGVTAKKAGVTFTYVVTKLEPKEMADSFFTRVEKLCYDKLLEQI